MIRKVKPIKGYKKYPIIKIFRYDSVRKYFRMDESLLKHEVTIVDNHKSDDLSMILNNKIGIRINKISIDYDNKVNKILDRLIMGDNLELYSLSNLNKLIGSITRVTKSLSSSLASIVIGLEDIK